MKLAINNNSNNIIKAIIILICVSLITSQGFELDFNLPPPPTTSTDLSTPPMIGAFNNSNQPIKMKNIQQSYASNLQEVNDSFLKDNGKLYQGNNKEDAIEKLKQKFNEETKSPYEGKGYLTSSNIIPENIGAKSSSNNNEFPRFSESKSKENFNLNPFDHFLNEAKDTVDRTVPISNSNFLSNKSLSNGLLLYTGTSGSNKSVRTLNTYSGKYRGMYDNFIDASTVKY